VNRDFRDLLAEFNAHGVECLVVGLIFQIGLPPVRIDVLTAIDGVDFAEAWPARLLTRFADQSVAVLSRKHLNELPRSKLTGYQNPAMRMFPKGVTPECFYRGSSSGLAWIPAKSMRE
jgi:hypothetical protein